MKLTNRSFVLIVVFAATIGAVFLARGIFRGEIEALQYFSPVKFTSESSVLGGAQAKLSGASDKISGSAGSENNVNFPRKGYATLPSIKNYFPGLTDRELVSAVRKKLVSLEEAQAIKAAAILKNRTYTEMNRGLLPAANAGDADAMFELSDLLRSCGGLVANAAIYPEIRSAHSQQLTQCNSVTSDGYAESLRWLALAAREGSLSARARLLSLTGVGSEYANTLNNDPVLKGLLQQEILSSMHYFSELPDRNYIEAGWFIYSEGVFPKNDEYAAAYRLAGQSLRAWQFPNAFSTADHGQDVSLLFSNLSAAQQSAAIEQSIAILKRCCIGVPPALNYTKYRRP